MALDAYLAMKRDRDDLLERIEELEVANEAYRREILELLWAANDKRLNGAVKHVGIIQRRRPRAMFFYFGDKVNGWKLYGIHVGRLFVGISISLKDGE